MLILLIEDEIKVANFIKKGLGEYSYNVEVASDGIIGQKLAMQNEYDLIILDVLLPGQDGWIICKYLRNEGIQIPILLLTSLGQTDDKVKGLNLGADDYLTKPFEFKELIARVQAILRRKSPEKNPVLSIDDLVLDPVEHVVRRDDKIIPLTAKEFALLEYLLRNKKKVLSRTQISENIWGIDFDRGSNVVDAYIKFLRQKIDKGFSKALIHTVVGVGYVLKNNE